MIKPRRFYWPMVSQWVLPRVTQMALGVAAMLQVTLVWSASGVIRMIRSVRGSIFVIELALTLFPPPIPPVTQTAPAPAATTPGCSAERSRRWRMCSVCGSIWKSVGGARDPNGAFADGDPGRAPVDAVLQDDFRGFAVTGSDRLEPVVSVAVGADPGRAIAEGDRGSAVVQLENGGDFVSAEVDERDAVISWQGAVASDDHPEVAGAERLVAGHREREVRSYGRETGRPCPRRCRRYLP